MGLSTLPDLYQLTMSLLYIEGLF